MEDYSEINGRKVSGKGFEVIEAVTVYGMTAAAEVAASVTSDINNSLKGMNKDLKRLLEFETSGEVTTGKTPDIRRVDEHITLEEFDTYKKPGLRQNRLLFVMDRIPMLNRFEDKEAIYVTFPMGAYIAKSNYPFISPCYEIKNIYYIKSRRFVWAAGSQVPVRLEPNKILEQLVKLNNIKRTIDNRGKRRGHRG